MKLNLLTKIDAVARRRFLTLFMIGFLAFAGSWLLAKHRGVPVPQVHDEFSYLLAGDTFAHGRVTNPRHPMWGHFETFHELMRPTYMSKFPPGQGLFLAVGQILFGQPIYGVWLSAGLMCMAVCWMLYGWFRPRWALIGGFITVLQFGVFTYWSQSYWGGCVAAMGGALVFGALPRILNHLRTRDTLWLGLGMAVLANSRPLEGIIIGIPIGVLVLPWKIKWQTVDKQKLLIKVILPLSLVLLMTILGIGAYNKAVTGDSRTFPYVLYSRTYSSVPVLVWNKLGPPIQFSSRMLAGFDQRWLGGLYIKKRTASGFFKIMTMDSIRLFLFFFGYPLAFPSLAVMVLMACRRKISWRFILATFIVLGTCAALTYRAKAHYYAPLTCLVVFIVTYGLRCLSVSFPKGRLGAAVVALLMTFQLILNILVTPVAPAKMSLGRIVKPPQINQALLFTREELKDFLLRKKGQHLVFIYYPRLYFVNREWVYNDADIDRSPIVWARNLGAEKNAELLRYFKGRHVWYVKVFWYLPLYSFVYDKRY